MVNVIAEFANAVLNGWEKRATVLSRMIRVIMESIK